jgi:hypothetical protein
MEENSHVFSDLSHDDFGSHHILKIGSSNVLIPLSEMF